MGYQRVISAVVFLLVGTTATADEMLVARLVGNQFTESLRSEAPVSGGDVLGLSVVADVEASTSADKIFVRRPATKNGRVCLEIASRDGRYVASNTYEMPEASPGAFVLAPIGTQHPEIFRGASPRNLAILARMGTCPSPDGDIVLVAWGRAPELGSPIRVTVAVQGARSKANLVVGQGATSILPCERIREERGTAFDALCTLTLPKGALRPLTLQLQRCAFDECTLAPATRLSP